MASQAMQKLRGILRRGPVTASVPNVAATPAAADAASLQANVARLAAEVDRLRAAQQSLESKYDALAARDPTAATTPVPPTDFRRLDAAIATLQGRVSEILATQASAAIGAKRVDGSIAGVRDDLNGLNARIAKLDQDAAQDRKRVEASVAGASEVREAIDASTEQLTRARDELGVRAEELGQRLAARLAPLYLLSLVALLAALATLGILFWKL